MTAKTPPHTDHPLRHYDRTCPGCQYEAQTPKEGLDEATQRVIVAARAMSDWLCGRAGQPSASFALRNAIKEYDASALQPQAQSTKGAQIGEPDDIALMLRTVYTQEYPGGMLGLSPKELMLKAADKIDSLLIALREAKRERLAGYESEADRLTLRAVTAERERDELNIQLGAWQCTFGTPQLSHAQARLDATEHALKMAQRRAEAAESFLLELQKGKS